MLSEKVAYLKGLCEGLNLDENTPEGKLLVNIIDVLDEMAAEVMAIDDTQVELQNEIDEIDEDLADVEDYLYGEDDYDDFDIEDIDCPYCGEPIAIDADILDSDEDTIVCPACGKEFELEFDGCDCGCCDEDEE